MQTKISILFLYLLIINIIGLFLFGLDKLKARKKLWRIPEYILFLVSFLGGASGGLVAMVIFKHKLSKKHFTYGIPVLLLLNKLIEVFIIKIILTY